MRRTPEVLRVRGEHDLLAPLPALELERPRADRPGAKRVAELLDDVPWHDLGVADGQRGDERGRRLVERDLYGIAVLSDEPGDAPGAALAEFAPAPHVAEKIGRAPPGLG